ncbi:hypothetical protein CHS0354_021584 [Potamilus streckersoni]|uniref:DNA polymerase alpha subunit B n=1 Tax=Potamilus streckersoni TaxID=2493646 RepID=A0AAE0SPD9_9BIVA|nr:hypothetical protein CHS0354_021584 [Potamilus streckersoni]
MAFVSEEDLNDEFELFSITLDDPVIIGKLQELCSIYKVAASDIVTEWVAYSQTKKLSGISLEELDTFERQRLSKRQQPKASSSTCHTVYSIDTIQSSAAGIAVDDAEELLNTYGGQTPISKGSVSQKRQLTPENGPLKRFTGSIRSPVVPFSPASFSPASANSSKKYNSRNNPGEVVLTFGAKETDFQGTVQTECSIASYNSDSTLNQQFKYMFQKLSEKCHVLDSIIEELTEGIKKIHNLEEFSHAALPTQEDITVAGRISCDCNGKLNAKSVLLEGSIDTSAGKCVPVDLSQLKEYALFPGQIVAFEGNNSTGQKFVAKKLYQTEVLPFPNVQVKTEPVTSRMSVLLAAGPFTTSDSLSYEPLSDLIKSIQQTGPDVCILMGPFVDSTNEEIKKGKLTCTFDTLFRIQIEQIAVATERLHCHLIVMPSQRDMHHDFVYPQPPFRIANFNYKHVHLMPDPCTITINNVVFGMTSTDCLFHLGQQEIAFPPGSSDRLGRLVLHLLSQHSYYPLYPPGPEVNIDFEQYEKFATMSVTPHVFIVPSDLKYFVKDVKGCCCVNPGRVAKGQGGGTYAKLLIKTKNVSSNQSIVSNIDAQIIRI